MYKQAGNSIVVDVLENIIKCLFNRIYKQNEILDNIIKILSTVGVEKVDEIKDKNIVVNTIGKSAMFLEDKATYFCLLIDNFNNLKESINTSSNKYLKEGETINYNCIKLLEAINIEFSAKCYTTSTVELSIDKLFKLYERENKCDLKKELKKYLQIFKNMSFAFYEIPEGQTLGSYREIRLCDEALCIKNKIRFTYSPEMYELLKNNGTYTYMPPDVLKSLNANLAYKTILAHKKANEGTDKENILSVKELYDVLDLPRYKKGDKHFGRTLVEFESALNTINSMEWQYDIETNGRYKKWVNSNINIKWKTSPFIENVDERNTSIE